MSEGIVTCTECDCTGNNTCGHECLDSKNLCTLDELLICPCCMINRRKDCIHKYKLQRIDYINGDTDYWCGKCGIFKKPSPDIVRDRVKRYGVSKEI